MIGVLACAVACSSKPSQAGIAGAASPAGAPAGRPADSNPAPVAGAGGALDAAAGSGGGSGAAPDAGEQAGNAGGSTAGSMAAADAAVDAGATAGAAIDPPVPVGCVTDVAPGEHYFDCDSTVHGVSVPERCTETACGVIVDVHGGMMSSQMEDKNTDLRTLGRQYGYLVIQPNALQNPALLDQRLFVPDTPGEPGDDTRVMNILMQVIEAFHADPKRIHMTGFSEGGYMTWRWFCAHSDLLASVAPAAAGWECATLASLGVTPPEIGCEFTGSAVPARNIPVLYMQGMRDGLVDPMCADGWIRSHVFGALELGPGTVLAGDPDFQSAQYVRTGYVDPDGVPFEYIQHQYTTDSSFLGVPIIGHCYPGSTDLMVTPPAETLIPPDQLMAFGCQDDCDFDWGEEVIEFFIAHPKR